MKQNVFRNPLKSIDRYSSFKSSDSTVKQPKCFITTEISVKLSVRLAKSRHANICSKNKFFRENVVVITSSELRPVSHERYGNSTFYGLF